jgi:hypothetical protein
MMAGEEGGTMSTEQLEQRLTAVEQALAAIQQQLHVMGNGMVKPWQPSTPEEVEEYLRASAEYYHKLGQEPPPDWKPGDPIPDPGWWS